MNISSTGTDKKLCPVFIVGFPRTGTTLIYRILHRHSVFYPKICIKMPDYNPIIESHFDRLFYQYAVDLWCLESNNSPREWFANNSAAYTQFILDCFRSFHIHAATARGSNRILEKTPSHIFLCEFMVHAFPNARILCLRRDPADTAASFRRRRTKQTGVDGDWLDLANDLNAFIRCWNQNTAAWNKFVTRYPDQGYVVDYSTITTESAATVKEILHFVGEEIETDILAGPSPLEPLEWFDRFDSHIPAPNSEIWSSYITKQEAVRLRDECVPIQDTCSKNKNVPVK